MTRILDFADGFESSAQPDQGLLQASSIKTFADDASFLADKGAAVGEGDTYYNTTTCLDRFYLCGGWHNGVNDTDAQSIAGAKTFSDKATFLVDADVDGTLQVGGDLTVAGNFDVNGETTTFNTTVLDVEDANITVNKLGNQAAADLAGAGITVEMSDATDAALSYDSTEVTLFKIGELGSQSGIVSEAAAQALTNKTLTAPQIDGSTASAVSYIKLPSGTKAVLDALVRNEGTLVYATDEKKVYLDDGVQLVDISGSGGGAGGGINFVENPDMEAGISEYVSYKDAVQDTPEDGIGGSSTLVLAVDTVGFLRGTQSLKVSKPATDNQGEGWSEDIVIDPQDKNTIMELSFDHSVSANFVLGDNSDIQVFLYDVDNAELIPLFNGSGLTSSKGYNSSFQATDSLNYRLILHVATTNALAWDYVWDTVSVGPKTSVESAAMTDWTNEGMVDLYSGGNPVTKGTTFVDTFRVKRVGDSAHIFCEISKNVADGSATPGEYRVKLPSGLNPDYSKVDEPVIGTAYFGDSGDGRNGVARLLSDGIAMQYATGTYSTMTTASHGFAENGFQIRFEAIIPIVGWTSNLTVGNGQTFRMSSILANGTNVATTPVSLNEYRTMIGAASVNTTTDSAPAAGWAPSLADGMKVDGSRGFAQNGNAGEPGKWIIFVGKNKQVKFEFYSSAGKTKNIDVDTILVSSTQFGIKTSYDPTTGLAIVDGNTLLGSVSTSRAGGRSMTSDGSAASDVAEPYFDIIVSENVQAIGMDDDIVSYAAFDEDGGAGIVNTQNRTFNNITVEGFDISATNDANTGAEFEILRAGKYEVSYTYRFTANQTATITKNVNDYPVGDVAWPTGNVLCISDQEDPGRFTTMTRTVFFNIGDVVRVAYFNGGASANAGNQHQFSCVRVR